MEEYLIPRTVISDARTRINALAPRHNHTPKSNQPTPTPARQSPKKLAIHLEPGHASFCCPCAEIPGRSRTGHLRRRSATDGSGLDEVAAGKRMSGCRTANSKDTGCALNMPLPHRRCNRKPQLTYTTPAPNPHSPASEPASQPAPTTLALPRRKHYHIILPIRAHVAGCLYRPYESVDDAGPIPIMRGLADWPGTTIFVPGSSSGELPCLPCVRGGSRCGADWYRVRSGCFALLRCVHPRLQNRTLGQVSPARACDWERAPQC